MGFNEVMEKKMNEILISTEEMLQELDKEIEVLKKQITELESKREGVENLRKAALQTLGLSEESAPKSKKEEPADAENEENLLEEDNPEEDLDTSFLD